MAIAPRIKATITTARATSRPVWVFVVAEAVIGLGVAVALGLAARGITGDLALDDLPPLRALAVLPAAGAAARTLWALGPRRVLRHWHGVAVRRIDQRWAAER
jgi:hypothetical protein